MCLESTPKKTTSDTSKHDTWVKPSGDKPKFEVGQKWRTKDGGTEITEVHPGGGLTAKAWNADGSEVENRSGRTWSSMDSYKNGFEFQPNGSAYSLKGDHTLVSLVGKGRVPKPGMLIKGLRGIPETGPDSIMKVVNGKDLTVSMKEWPEGIYQSLTDAAQVRYPWETEWTPAIEKEVPEVPQLEIKVGSVYKTRSGKLVHVRNKDEDGIRNFAVVYLNGGALNSVGPNGHAHDDRSMCPDDLVELVSASETSAA